MIRSTTNAVTARVFVQSTPHRACHVRRWRGAKTKNIARLIAFKKMRFPLPTKDGGYDHQPKKVVAQSFTVRTDARERPCHTENGQQGHP